MRIALVSTIYILIFHFAVVSAAAEDTDKVEEMKKTESRLFSHEPSVRMVQVMALTYAGLEPHAMRDMHGRVRRAAWLPEVSLSVRNGEDNRSRDVVSLELTDATGDTSLAETRTAEFQVEATAKFRFSELVFSPEEVDVARENRYSARLRLLLLTRVTDVYFARRRQILERHVAGSMNGPEKTMRGLKIEQLTAELDGLTGGAFNRHLTGVSP